MRNRKHDIEKYLRGELSPAEMHALEKDALNDPFLAEALEGVAHAGADNFLHDLHRINRKVHDRTRRRKHKSINIWGWTTGMAAAVLLIAVSGFLVISLLKDQAARQQAMKEQSAAVAESADTVVAEQEPAASDQAIGAEDSAPSERQHASDRGRETAEQPAAQNAGDTYAQNGDRIAQQDTSRPEDKAEVTTQTEVEVDREPIALAEIPREAPVATESREPDARLSSKKHDGRTASVDTGQKPVIARSPSAAVTLLRGKVTSAIDGDGLPGVYVALKGTNVGTVTDAEGNYQLPVPTAETHVMFSFIGFESREETVKDQEELNVALEEDVTAFSEVVIISGYGMQNNSSDNSAAFMPAAPAGGKNDFQSYLAGAVVYPEEALLKKAEGRVTVRFTVQADGELTDFEVLKGIGHGCDEELIRATKAGPAWEAASRGGVPLPDKVKVTYRFELPK